MRIWKVPGLPKMKRLLTGRQSSTNRFPEQPPLLASYGALDAIVAEASNKLWTEFSRHAHRDLEEAIDSARRIEVRAFAACELAKFHAAKAHWEKALHYLKTVKRLWPDLLHGKEVGLIFIEALISCGHTTEADRHVRRKVEKEAIDADYLCALSNVMATVALRDIRADRAGRARLALLNTLYKGDALAELELNDAALGFTLGNLTPAWTHLPTVHRADRVSVLLSVRNAEPFLAVTVSSILRQTWHNLELVIVDDASADESWDIINHFGRRDSRVVAVRNAADMGPYQSRNRALSLAAGDFICVHDSHGWSHPQMLERLMGEMRADSSLQLALPGTARVSLDMKYGLSVGQRSVEYVAGSSSSLFFKMSDLQHLGKWDEVASGADEEFVQRAKTILGDQFVREVSPKVPISFRLDLPEEETELRSSCAGREYSRQAEFWRRSILLPARTTGAAVTLERVSVKQPFPVPPSIMPKQLIGSRHYDLVIISDLTLLGGTRRCNEGYIAAATRLGMRIGLLHWARYDLKLKHDIAQEYRRLSYGDNVDILTGDDHVSADLVLIHHPPIMKYLPDKVPAIRTQRVAILVNQLPTPPVGSGRAYYERNDVESDCLRLFGLAPVWIPISPLVRRVLKAAGFSRLAKEDWIPPLGGIATISRRIASEVVLKEGRPVIGRHSRDYWTKWPESEKDLRAAYCADSQMRVHFLGGAKYARKMLTTWPENWHDLAFDSMRVSDFLNSLDFLVHFTHSTYVEEFGRNVMEAMAVGIPAIVPHRFEEVFGDAACYAKPQQVVELIDTLWNCREAYLDQVEKGLRFVREFASSVPVERRLEGAVRGRL